MRRRIGMLIISLIGIIALSAILILSRKEFGRVAKGERLERIRKSTSFVDEHFRNEVPTRLFTGKENRLKMTWKALASRSDDRSVPQEGEVPVVHTDLKNLPAEGDLYVWFGHSSFLLRLSGQNILVDPVFHKASPFSFINRAFKGTAIYKPQDMPERIDYLVISHDHWDHLDYQTVTELRDRVRKVVVPLGIGESFEYWGYPAEKIIEMDWRETCEADDSLTIHCLPTRHFTGRGLWNPKTIPASWLLETPQRKVFYTGDGGYSERFRHYGEQFPDIDLAIMENGQYNENWSQIHTLPRQLGLEVKELKARRFVTVHHSKFKLSNHPWDEPRRNEQQAARDYNLKLITAKIGEVIKL